MPGEAVDHVDDGQLPDGGGADVLAFRVTFSVKFSVLGAGGGFAFRTGGCSGSGVVRAWKATSLPRKITG